MRNRFARSVRLAPGAVFLLFNGGRSSASPYVYVGNWDHASVSATDAEANAAVGLAKLGAWAFFVPDYRLVRCGAKRAAAFWSALASCLSACPAGAAPRRSPRYGLPTPPPCPLHSL